jgi:hypothetical protein
MIYQVVPLKTDINWVSLSLDILWQNADVSRFFSLYLSLRVLELQIPHNRPQIMVDIGTIILKISAHSDGGPCSPSHQRKFSGTLVCRVTFKHLPQPLRSFGTLGQLFKIPPFSGPKLHSAGGRGGPPIIFGLES